MNIEMNCKWFYIENNFIKETLFWLVFYGISTFPGYLMPNPVYIYDL